MEVDPGGRYSAAVSVATCPHDAQHQLRPIPSERVDPAHQVLGRTSTGEQMAVAVTCPTCSEERGSPVYFGEGLDGGPVELIVPPETAVDHGGPKTSRRRLPRTIAVGVGAIVRHTAGAVAVLFAVLLIIPGLVQLLPQPWNNDITLYLPSSAGAAMSAVVRFPNLLSPLDGFVVLTAYALVTFAVASSVLARRDA